MLRRTNIKWLHMEKWNASTCCFIVMGSRYWWPSLFLAYIPSKSCSIFTSLPISQISVICFLNHLAVVWDDIHRRASRHLPPLFTLDLLKHTVCVACPLYANVQPEEFQNIITSLIKTISTLLPNIIYG